MADRIVPRRHAKISGPSLTEQAEAAKTDINALSQRVLRQRLQGNPNGRQPIYGVMPSASYHEMMNKIVAMDSQFNRLGPKIRRRFMNRPELMLAFLEDENNRREALQLGLIDDPELAAIMRREEAEKRGPKADADQVDLVDESGEIPDSEGALEEDEEAQPRKRGKAGNGRIRAR